MENQTEITEVKTTVKGKGRSAKAVVKANPAVKTSKKKDAFGTLLIAIKQGSDKLADSIHTAGLLALRQANIHNDIGYAVRLVEALGVKHDKKRVVGWLTHFGKLAWTKEKGLIFRKRKDINESTVEAKLKQAGETPYWELQKQEEPKVTFDFLSQCASIIKRYETLEADDSKEVTVKNESILAQLKTIVQQHSPAVVH